MTDPELNALIEEVLAEAANPSTAANLNQRLQERILMPADVLTLPLPTFATLDRSAAQPTARKAVTTAVLLNLAALLLVTATVHTVTQKADRPVTEISLLDPPPPAKAAPKAALAAGGGGQRGPAAVSKGNPPEFANEQLNAPKAPPTMAPKINIPVTVEGDPHLNMAHADVPNFGVSNSPLVGMSMGNGNGTGLGSGNGAGIGPGTAGNTGGGLRRIGGGVSAPVALYTPEPEFSEEARKAKVSGNVIVYLQVDEQGRATHVRVVRGLGMGLDEKALAAVQQYRFKPAEEHGHPVRVEMNVDVNFQIF